jgi:sulfate adenylyltransferase subunit 1
VVVALPSGRRTTVVGIDLGESELDEAAAGRSVTLRLADDVDLSRGDTLVAADDVPAMTQDVTAVLCWLGDTELRPGARVLVKHRSRTVPAVVRSIEGRLDLDTLATQPSQRLSLNDIGQVALRTASPLPIEDYARSRAGGAFLVIDPADGNTVAAGMAGTP